MAIQKKKWLYRVGRRGLAGLSRAKTLFYAGGKRAANFTGGEPVLDTSEGSLADSGEAKILRLWPDPRKLKFQPLTGSRPDSNKRGRLR